MTDETRSPLTGHPTGHSSAPVTASASVTVTGDPVTVTGHPLPYPHGHVTGDPVTGDRGQMTARGDRPAVVTSVPVTSDPVTVTGASDPVTPDHLKPIPKGLRTAVTIVTWGLSAINGGVAGVGQFEHARRTGVRDWTAFAFPFSMEFTAAAFIMLGYVQARRGRSPYILWAVGAGFGLWAVYMQLDAGGATGRLFAGTTIASLAMWYAKLTGDYKDYLRNADRSGLGALWLGGFRIARRATLIKWQVRDKVKTTTELIELAAVWNAVYDDVRTHPQTGERLSRRLRRRHAWRETRRAAGMNVPALPGMTSLETVGVAVTAPVTPPPAPVTMTGHPDGQMTEYPAGPYAPRPAVTGHRSLVNGQRTRVTRAVPVSPAPAGGGDPLVFYADEITAVQKRIPDWATRPDRIPPKDVSNALKAAFEAGELSRPSSPTAKGTVQKIGWLIETLTDRKHSIPDDMWIRYLSRLDRDAILAN